MLNATKRDIEMANAVFVTQKDGNLRCKKNRWLDVTSGHVYTPEFVKAYASNVPNVLIIEGVSA